MAEELVKTGGTLIHYSTDYVFDGSKSVPYVETDSTGPLSVYGRTKLEGEQAIIATGCEHVILRTSWVYDVRGKNFLRTVLRLAKDRDELRMVGDQFGAPTWARTIAEATAAIAVQVLRQPGEPNCDARGVFHLTSAGETSWAGFARAILEDYDELLDWPAETGEFGGELQGQAGGGHHDRGISDAGEAAKEFGAVEHQDSGRLRNHYAGVAQPVAACHAGRDSLIMTSKLSSP